MKLWFDLQTLIKKNYYVYVLGTLNLFFLSLVSSLFLSTMYLVSTTYNEPRVKLSSGSVTSNDFVHIAGAYRIKT